MSSSTTGTATALWAGQDAESILSTMQGIAAKMEAIMAADVQQFEAYMSARGVNLAAGDVLVLPQGSLLEFVPSRFRANVRTSGLIERPLVIPGGAQFLPR